MHFLSSSFAWSADRIETLGQLWRDGQSAAQIARVLGGVSRSAVIGKIHRLGLAARAAASPPGRRSTARAASPQTRSAWPAKASIGRQTKVFPRPATAPPRAEACPVPATPLLHDACALTARTCRWPIGDPRAAAFGYCGRRVTRGGPYCDGHRGLAYVRPSRRQAEALRPPPG